MAAVVFPKSSTPGAVPSEGEGRKVNSYMEMEGDKPVEKRVAGLVTKATLSGASGPRGMVLMPDGLYVAYSGTLIKVASNFSSSTALTGGLAGTDGVFFARNNRVTSGASTPDLVAVRETGGAFIASTSAVSAYPDADLPSTVNSVDFLGGFFLFTLPDGRIFASELNSTAVNPLSFTTAEAAVDGLVRGLVFSGRYYAFGSGTIEVYGNQGLQPFPLVRFPTVMNVGLLTAQAVAGYELGWDRTLLFVAKDATVREIQGGFSAPIVSTADVTRFIQASTLSALHAFVITYRDRALWVLTSDIGTWEFDLTTRTWAERKSNGVAYWRSSRSAKVGDDWIVADRVSPVLGRVADGVRTEYGAQLAWQFSGRLREFPSRIVLPDLESHFSPSAATVTIEISKDGGATFPDVRTRSLAAAGKHPVRVNRLGLSSQHGVTVRYTITDDADFGFMGATMQRAEARAA